MIFDPPLEKATLVKRYKRFLADVEHPSKGSFTAHCPNTGSMKNCWQPGWNVWLQDSQNLKRKYRYTWVLAENPAGEFIGINSQGANRLVFDAISEGKITELSDVEAVETEVKYGEENSRIDILVTDSKQSKTYIEVKSVTLKGIPDENGHLNEVKDNEGRAKGCFPDAVTTRGQKHIRELMHCASQGHRAILFFLVQHTGIETVEIAQSIDPDYAQLIKEALSNGVEVIAYCTEITPTSIKVSHSIPFCI
jgi:sugar fermentation stimulation protein A